MPDRLTREQATLWAAIRRGIGAVDGIFRRMARALRDALAPYRERERLTHADRRAILRAVDAILAPVFGMTRATARAASLTRLIVDMSADAGEGVFRRAYDRLARIIERRDPALWQRVRLASLLNPAERGLPAVVAMFDGPAIRAERLRRARFLDPERRWVDGTRRTLSDRVWLQGQHVRRQIDDTIRDAIRRGEGPVTLGRRLEAYVNPANNPTRYLGDGQIVTRAGARPSRIGYASNVARRLARTEISHAFNQAVADAALDIPGVTGLKYALSGSHPKIDSCNPLADRDLYGMGRGVYPVRECPIPPAHPNCLCGIRAVYMPDDDLVDLIVKRYGGMAA